MLRTTVGYSGGKKPEPTYRMIGDHSEVVRIEFDPRVISYDRLLGEFWESHDPTHRAYSRQYRNAVFTYNEQQRILAEASAARIAAERGEELKTSVEPAGAFTAAEDGHQKYLLRQADDLMAEFKAIYPDTDDLAASTAAARVNGYLGCNGDPEDLTKELSQLGLSTRMQSRLGDYVSRSCGRFAAMTCPLPN